MTISGVLSKNFTTAIKDYYYLINKNYPFKPTLKLVADKFRLNTVERSVFLRGVVSRENSNFRNQKIITSDKVKNNNLEVDFFNVILTLTGYFSGGLLYLSTDGFLRDASENHGKNGKINFSKVQKHLNLILDYLEIIKPRFVTFYLDSPVSGSGELAEIINKKFESSGIKGKAKTVKSADYSLKLSEEICATSDSVIIDSCEKIFDLARAVLTHFYKKEFLSLKDLLD